MAEKSVMQRIKELDAERATILEQAKEELLRKATQAIEELNGLGLNYRLTSGVSKPSKSSGAKAKREATEVPCPICKFQTSPPHDGRTHRSQGKKKKPFSQEELADRSLTKVG